ncbi:MAG: ATP-binding protein [Nitrospiraceae bacterium]|nr:MAG: ATP-binding protein [Nitrospiraceae bacterium]
MAGNAVPTKVSAGGGFVFENKVAAYFLACMLKGRPPLDAQLGTISNIDFQVNKGGTGWLFDDILLTLKYGSKISRCALSVKSNTQFGKATAPKAFVTLAWKQYLHDESDVFNPKTDYIGLITGPLQVELQNDLGWLIDCAQKQPPEEFLQRISQKGGDSLIKKKLFHSFACPTDLAENHGITEKETGNLLLHIRIVPFDFEQPISEKEKDAIALCQSSLRSGNAQESVRLWSEIQNIADRYRPSGGRIDLCTLIDLLRHQFILKNHPDFEHDWNEINIQTDQNLQTIPDKIGGSVSVQRPADLKSIQEGFLSNNVQIVLGESGCGKTVLLKQWTESLNKPATIIWLDSGRFDTNSLEAVIEKLQHHLGDVLNAVISRDAYLIIDGVDRLYKDKVFKHVSLLLSYLRLESENTPWKIILSCQLHDWQRVQKELLRFNIDSSKWGSIQISNPSYEDLKPVWASFPELSRLLLNNKLVSLLTKPAILDIMARNLVLRRLPDTRQWAGISDVINWFWNTEISQSLQGAALESFLFKLAQMQGDELKIELPLDKFNTEDLTAVELLEKKRICYRREGKINFSHDLYGDWARQRQLLAHTEDLLDFVMPRLSSPLWQRAAQLLSLHLIEQDADITRWRNMLLACDKETEDYILLKDLLLEAAIHAADAFSVLERIWDDLIRDDGKLLQRLLNRLLHAGTSPHPMALKLAKELKDFSETEASVLQRIPIPLYWIPIIRFLYAHKKEVVELVPEQVADIVNKWLIFTENNYPLRKEAAEIGLEVAWSAYILNKYWRLSFIRRHFSHSKNLYRPVLASVNDLPEQVTEFVLTACGRKEPPPPPPVNKPPEEINPVKAKLKRDLPPSISIFAHDEIDIPQWPDGPKCEVDRMFQDLCLDEPSILIPLFSALPDVAEETVLALIIREPGKRSRDEYPYDRHEPYEIDDRHGWFPSFYDRGPFWFFLTIRPEKGLNLILRLINFVTDRWTDIYTHRSIPIPSVIMSTAEGEKTWIGDNELFFAYRDCGDIPHVIVSALMALEKWFYDRLEAKESVAEAIETIIKNTRSVVFAGLLIGVGKSHPELFKSILRPFLTVPEFYRWEMHHRVDGEGHQMIGWGELRHTKEQIKRANEWNNMAHRKIELYAISQSLFLNDEDGRKIIEDATSKWEVRLEAFAPDDELCESGYLERLIREFDINNWESKSHPEHGEYWEFNPPREFKEQQEIAFKELSDRKLLIGFPMQCRELLDKNLQLSQDYLETFWDILKRIENLSVPEDIEDGLITIQDSLCAGAAVLIEFHRDWLRKHPIKEEWCIKHLINTTKTPPSINRSDSSRNICRWKWYTFCAQAIPILWSENPDSKELRELVISLTTDKHYVTVEILFRQAAKHRHLLRDNLLQLQNFLLHWSAARYKLTRVIYVDVGRNKKQEKEKDRIKKESDALAQQFINGITTLPMPKWNEIALIDTRPSLVAPDSKGKFYPRDPGLNFEVIESAYSWIPSIDHAIDERDRKNMILFWEESLNCILWMLGNGSEEIEDIEGHPYTFERWVFQYIPDLILHLHPEEKPENFWKPILSLGSPAHNWIGDFLSNWFYYDINTTQKEEAFIRIWKQMLDFAFSSSRWSSGFYYRLQEIWNKLMGLDGILLTIWDEKRKSLVDHMADYYERWANLYLQYDDCAEAYLLFLQQPAAESLRLKSLVWLYKGVSSHKDGFWYDRQKEHENRLAKLLDLCWQSHRTELRQGQDYFDAFKNLLKILVQRQNNLAMELSDRVSEVRA